MFLANRVLCGSCEAGGRGSARREERQVPALLYHTGNPVEPIRGETRAEGAHAQVALDPMLQGDPVRHDLVLRNDRSEALELRRVKACSGCTLDGHAREIAPGGEGRISILLPTDSEGSKTIEGTVRAETNDPDRPRIEVDLSLPVREFAAGSPYPVWLRGRALGGGPGRDRRLG